MKKTLVLSCCIVALCACKAEIEKDISLKALLNEPIKVESGILNVEIATCSSHEDSRKPSDALIQIQQKIPHVFDNAVYKECYQKNFNSFASFEIPIAVGKLDDSSEIKHNVNIYSYKNHYLNVQTSDKLAKNIRDFMDREYLSDLTLNLTLKINNDTNQALDVTFISAYVNDSPVDFLPLTFKQGESIEVKLSNASSDMLWQYETSPSVSVMTKGFELDDILK